MTPFQEQFLQNWPNGNKNKDFQLLKKIPFHENDNISHLHTLSKIWSIEVITMKAFWEFCPKELSTITARKGGGWNAPYDGKNFPQLRCDAIILTCIFEIE